MGEKRYRDRGMSELEGVESSMVSGVRRMAHWARVGLFLCVMTGAPAEELKYPRMTTERILSAQPNKFRDIELVRDYQEGEITGYRWLIHDGRRDRRGPGKYVNRSHCILYAPTRHAKVVKETADEFELVIELSEYDQESTIRITVKRRSPNVANAWVRIDGKGEIYDEFVAQVDAVQKGADEVLWEGNRGEHVPKGSGNMLRWFYLAQPKGRVID